MPGRFFLTTPIYYVNDVPHIGHAYTTVTADALARWHRLLGDEVFFLTGTDEHGLKIARAAEAQGLTPQEQADRTSARFQEAWALLDIAPDRFIRTTDPDHHATVQAFLQKVYDNGHIYKSSYAGWYCVACEAYYADEDLEPNSDDGPGLCPVHARPVEWFEEDNWFFRLSAFEQPLLDWYAANPSAVGPDGKRNEALGSSRADCETSRSPVRRSTGGPGPLGRPARLLRLVRRAHQLRHGGGLRHRPARFADWWPHVHHLLAKDILRFHCVYWPAMLLAAGEDPPAHINVHGYLLVGGER